jgi:hypothetical protein
MNQTIRSRTIRLLDFSFGIFLGFFFFSIKPWDNFWEEYTGAPGIFTETEA